MYGGSPMPLGVLEKAHETIPSGYMHAYGITETSGILTLLRPEHSKPRGTPEEVRKTNSAGHVVLSSTIEIMNDQDAILPTGEIGEIVVRGPRVMTGYWNKPKATAEALRGGWYRTGDLGYFDAERNVHVVDRKKDMIISGGENVYSVEVENILSTHPGRAGMCGDRHPARDVGRDGPRCRGEARSADGGGRGVDRVLPRQDRGLQDSEVGVVFQRAASQDGSRQDQQASAARHVLAKPRDEDLRWARNRPQDADCGLHAAAVANVSSSCCTVWAPMHRSGTAWFL